MTLQPQPTGTTGAARPSTTLWWASGLWLGLALIVLRLGVLGVMEGVSHGVDAERLRVRLADAVPAVVLMGLVTGVAAGAVVALARRTLGAGRLAAALAVVVAAALIWAQLTGRLSTAAATDVSRQVGLGTSRGVATAAALGALALVLGAALARRAAPADGRPPRTLDAVLPLALAGLMVLVARPFGALDARMTVRDVVVDLVAEPEAWQWLEHRPDAPPHIGVICPCTNFQVHGGDKPSLVLPPPAAAQVRLGPDGRPLPPANRLDSAPGVTPDAPSRPEGGGGDAGGGTASTRQGLWLDATAGVDQSVIVEHGEALAGAAIRFEVLARWPGEATDRRLYDERIPLVSLEPVPGTEWRTVGGDDGLPVRAGDTLTLRTTLLGPDGRPLDFAAPLAAGFGGLTLERRTETPRQPSSPDAPNIVFLVMDTQRADRLSAYGYERPTSPHLERLAARGVRFTEAHATASWTWPSTASLLTGLHPEEHGVTDSSSCHLADALATLPEALQAAGWTTAAWSANVLIVPDKNFDQGFEFFDHPAGTTRQSTTFMPAVLEWIEATAGTRFFLYLQLLDPHAPLIPLPEHRARFAKDVPADFSPYEINVHRDDLQACFQASGGGHAVDDCVSPQEQTWVSDLYDAATASGDHWLGALLDTLEAAGLDDETIVVFTSDHGEELYDHGLVTHGHTLHRELVRVPLVIAGPGVPRGEVRTPPVSNRHLAATLSRLAGVPFAAPPDALDLLGDDLDARARRDPLLFSTREGWWNGRVHVPLWGLRHADTVVHWAPDGRPVDAPPEAAPPEGEVRLYDLVSDPGERHDLSARRPEDAARTRQALDALVETLRARRIAPELPAGQATMELLERIGYLDGGDEAPRR